MKGFLEVQGLCELEHTGEWDKARELLYKLWCDDKNNINTLCRVLSECWYVLTEWECSIQNKNLSFPLFKRTLMESTNYGFTHFDSTIDFLWMAGYMIFSFPYLFYESNKGSMFEEWEQKGRDMLYHATQIEPNHIISKVLYLGTQSISEEYLKAKEQLIPLLDTIFPGHTAIEEYFKDVLSK